MSSTTSIALGLKQAKRLAKQISKVHRRAEQYFSWSGDEDPTFSFQDLVTEEQRLITERLQIKAAIDLANATTMVKFEDVEISLALAIRMHRELKGEHSFYEDLQVRAGEVRGPITDYDERNRPIYEMIEWHSAMTEPERVAKVDELQLQIDELDDVIETANRRTKIEV